MGTFFGPRPAARDFGDGHPIPSNSQQGATPVSFSRSQITSTEQGVQGVAVGASVRLLQWLVSSLPVDFYRGQGPEKKREVDPPRFFADPDGSGQGWDDWVRQVVYSAALRGNAVGDVVATDGMGRPLQMVVQHPDDVSVRETDTGPEWRFKGKVVDRDRVEHRRINPVPGSRLGMSVISAHAVSVLQGQAAQAFGLRWFLDGAHPSAILQNTDQKEIKQGDASTVKAKFLAAMRGVREPVVLGAGWEYKPIQVTANESQFLETMRYSDAQCARMFGPALPEILGYETGGSMTYANVEQRSIDLLKLTLNPWLHWLEAWMSSRVCTGPVWMRFNRGALLETDLLSRYRAYEIGIRSKFLVPNDAREKEDEAPLPGGDVVVENPSPAPASVKVEE
jgi:HK97 family phage portal protein